ncbi:TsaA-like domain-containing protein [Pavlovales sp. CCMP2436]|nr:TsaA-like domain-containing protein [Pavlovales sp. CCMP2436]|mmetsp:Transcript_3915/g.9931  ORF Transcript_3915/g.9931 Transcript_3915/m.9931 type:complete len:505 (+) Transcript_3915:72-1586(+)
MEGELQTCRMHWSGSKTVFAVPLGANLWEVFGKGCFVIEQESRRAIPIDPVGFTAEPLRADMTYALFSKSGPKLLRECHHLRTQMNVLRDDLARVQQRSLRFERVTTEQLRSASELLAAAIAPREQGAPADVQGITEAMRTLRSLQRRIETGEMGLAEAGAEPAQVPRAAAARAPPTPDAEADAEPGVTVVAEAGDSASGSGEAAGGAILAGVGPRGGCARGKPDHPHQWTRVVKASGQQQGGGGVVSITPIGHIRSCFAEKNGTPRQGSIAPSSRAVLELKLPSSLNPLHAVDGLEHFSHVWLLWHFHQNGPAAIRSKVSPPRLDGERVGLYATRSPHRPNAIGLSAVRLERIEGSTLYLSGVDLIDGTPIFDVKPYVPIADSLPLEQVRVPPWLRPETAPVSDLEVDITEAAREQIRGLEPALAFFRSAAEAEEAIKQVLRADPRSVFWRHQHADEMYGFSIDQLNVVCHFSDGRAHVTGVEHLALSDRAHSLKPTGDDRDI